MNSNESKLPDIPGQDEWVNPDFVPKVTAQPHLLKKIGGVSYCMLPGDLNYLGATPDDPIIFPKEFQIIAAFDDKGLAGRIMMCALPHMEGTWVREDKRGSKVALHLVRMMEQFIAYVGNTYAWAFVQESDQEVADYMARIGYTKIPLTVWTKCIAPDSPPTEPMDETTSKDN